MATEAQMRKTLQAFLDVQPRCDAIRHGVDIDGGPTTSMCGIRALYVRPRNWFVNNSREEYRCQTHHNGDEGRVPAYNAILQAEHILFSPAWEPTEAEVDRLAEIGFNAWKKADTGLSKAKAAWRTEVRAILAALPPQAIDRDVHLVMADLLESNGSNVNMYVNEETLTKVARRAFVSHGGYSITLDLDARIGTIVRAIIAVLPKNNPLAEAASWLRKRAESELSAPARKTCSHCSGEGCLDQGMAAHGPCPVYEVSR